MNTSHKAVNVVSSSHRQHLLSYTFVLGCSSPSGWHCDHGCHTTHAVFSKTAEDSLAHVTTASRLTCYHGDKSANENSADGCDVDCKLFVLRGDLFFFSSPPPPLHPSTATETQTPLLWHMCMWTHTFSQKKKNTRRLLRHTQHTHAHTHYAKCRCKGCTQKMQGTKETSSLRYQIIIHF